MFGSDNSFSQQSVTIQLNPDGDSFAIQPAILPQSFATWMEAWNIYLSVHTSLNPSCTMQLIHYQCIITSANTCQYDQNSAQRL